MTYYELLQFFKKYQTFIYTGNREGDLDLLEGEVKELYQVGMITKDFYLDALMTIMKERRMTK